MTSSCPSAGRGLSIASCRGRPAVGRPAIGHVQERVTSPVTQVYMGQQVFVRDRSFITGRGATKWENHGSV